MISSFYDLVVQQHIVPIDLYELFFQFAYGIRSYDIDFRQLNCLNVAKLLPTPRNWLNYIKFTTTEGYHVFPTFNYQYFLRNINNCPFSVTSHINIDGVRETIGMLHWPALNRTHSPFFSWMYRLQKQDLFRTMESWCNLGAIENVFYLQRMIPLLEKQHFRKNVTLLKRIKCIYLRHTSPLGLYLKPPYQHSSFWI